MTTYAVRSIAGVWWQGGDRWTVHEAEARQFAFMADAVMAAIVDCDRPCAEWTVEAVAR